MMKRVLRLHQIVFTIDCTDRKPEPSMLCGQCQFEVGLRQVVLGRALEPAPSSSRIGLPDFARQQHLSQQKFGRSLLFDGSLWRADPAFAALEALRQRSMPTPLMADTTLVALGPAPDADHADGTDSPALMVSWMVEIALAAN